MKYKCEDCGYLWARRESGSAKCCQRCASYRIKQSGCDYQMFFDRLTERGFEVLMNFPPIPENPDPAKFNRLVYVDNVVSSQAVVEAIGSLGGKPLKNFLNFEEVLEASLAEDRIVDDEYFIWVQDGQLYKGKCAASVVPYFSDHERGARLHEGLFMLMFYPDIWADHYLFLPGSWYGFKAQDLMCSVGVNVTKDPIVCAINRGRTFSDYGCVSVAKR